jgi:hypothetical protein
VDVDSADLLPAPMLDMAHSSNRLKLLRLRAEGLIRPTEVIELREAVVDERYRMWQREAGDADELSLAKRPAAATKGEKVKAADFGMSHKDKVLALMHRLGQKERRSKQPLRLNYTQVVREVSFPQFFFSLEGLKGMLEPRSKLRPKRTDRTTRASQMRKYNLIVQVRTIANLPTRVAMPSQEGGASLRVTPKKGTAGSAAAAVADDDDGASETAVFVEVSFQNGTQRSNVSVGRSPLWNDQV